VLARCDASSCASMADNLVWVVLINAPNRCWLFSVNLCCTKGRDLLELGVERRIHRFVALSQSNMGKLKRNALVRFPTHFA